MSYERNQMFNLQLFNDGEGDPSPGINPGDGEGAGEGAGEGVEGAEGADETIPEETAFSLDYMDLDKEGVLTERDRARELVQKGLAQERLDKAGPNKAHQWAEEQMKKEGYDNPEDFINAKKLDSMTKKYKEEGFTSEMAKKQASNDLKIQSLEEKLNQKEETTRKKEDMKQFLEWHEQKQKNGVFSDKLDLEKDIPAEVWEKVEGGENLRTAFMENYLDTMQTKIEQATIKKLNGKGDSSTGSVVDGSVSEDGKMSIETIEKNAIEKGEKWIDANYDAIVASGYYDN